MADNSGDRNSELLRQVKTLLWGNIVKEDVFKRWAQGFYFSPEEATALVQTEGGPCAVIAPVQAFILKQLLAESDPDAWTSVGAEKQDALLARAAAEIVSRAANPAGAVYRVVRTDEDRAENGGVLERSRVRDPSSREPDEDGEVPAGEDSPLEPLLDSQTFHSRLRIFEVESLDLLEKYFLDRIDALKESYGVLHLLYTVVCTKGIAGMRSEISDPAEPIIDSTYGYGSQSLINLMLTGRAVSHVWDYDQDIGGLKLRGIDKQNAVGFLALLEHLRYCEVGAFLKSPAHPVWVLGSETHLTVLFSTDRRLVSPETPAERARRVFKKFDPEGNNFISANLLQEVLEELDLCADAEYVSIMRKKLDSECLGIILLVSFMDEFFPEEPRTCPDTFPLYHYNGLPRSNPNNGLKYQVGQAVLLECNVKCIMDSNPMLTILQTKWPSIEMQWSSGKTPSLN